MTPFQDLIADVDARIRPGDVRQLVELLADNSGSWGHEAGAAAAVAPFLHRLAPRASVVVDRFGDDRANLIATSGTEHPGGPELVVCSHLDTSLTGSAALDAPITGRRDPVGELTVTGSTLVGPGLGVARVPAAAASVGFAAATSLLDERSVPHRVSLLLAAGGTHRRGAGDVEMTTPPTHFGVGVRRALGAGWRPDSVLLAKAGPPVVLHEEPGSAYVDIELRGEMLPALIRTATEAGPLGHLGAVLDAIERWRSTFVARPTTGQVGRELAVGAVEAGSKEKCDLLPAVVRLSLYLVLGHGDAMPAIESDLRVAIGAAVPDGMTVRVRTSAWDPAGATSPDARVVVAALAATRAGTDISGWRGSTDGAVFRSVGIDTARWGPSIEPDGNDPRRDRVDLDTAVAAARTYAEILLRFVLDDRYPSDDRT